MILQGNPVLRPPGEERPSLNGNPAAMASLLGHGIPAGLVERMMAAPSSRTRLDGELRGRLGTLPDDVTAAQSHLLLLDPAGLVHLALRAGAIWHAGAIARVHDGATVRALVERIGPEFREVALADLADHPRVAAAEPSGIGLDGMPVAIARDGTACLIAWCEGQPRAIGWRVLMRLRMTGQPTSQHAELGPSIVERMAATQAKLAPVPAST